MPIDVTVRGLIETRKKLEQAADDLHGAPITGAMHKATLLVERASKVNSPVDTGRLRASITSEVRVEGLGGRKVTGIVGSNVVYSPYQELGTKPHFVPIGAIQVWARRHHMNPYAVQRAIAVRGIKPRRYLQRAFDDNRAQVIEISAWR